MGDIAHAAHEGPHCCDHRVCGPVLLPGSVATVHLALELHQRLLGLLPQLRLAVDHGLRFFQLRRQLVDLRLGLRADPRRRRQSLLELELQRADLPLMLPVGRRLPVVIGPLGLSDLGVQPGDLGILAAADAADVVVFLDHLVGPLALVGDGLPQLLDRQILVLDALSHGLPLGLRQRQDLLDLADRQRFQPAPWHDLPRGLHKVLRGALTHVGIPLDPRLPLAMRHQTALLGLDQTAPDLKHVGVGRLKVYVDPHFDVEQRRQAGDLRGLECAALLGDGSTGLHEAQPGEFALSRLVLVQPDVFRIDLNVIFRTAHAAMPPSLACAQIHRDVHIALFGQQLIGDAQQLHGLRDRSALSHIVRSLVLVGRQCALSSPCRNGQAARALASPQQ